MTDLSAGPRRRGGRRPGWVLLTALLVLAIGASSAGITAGWSLKLAVIRLSRRRRCVPFQTIAASISDQGRTRDLKLVTTCVGPRNLARRGESRGSRCVASWPATGACRRRGLGAARRLGRPAHQFGDFVRRRTQRAAGTGDRTQVRACFQRLGSRTRKRTRTSQPGDLGARRRASSAHGRQLDHRRARGTAGATAAAAGRG
jgi:hypothetical protein